jgi:hypothetical protein
MDDTRGKEGIFYNRHMETKRVLEIICDGLWYQYHEHDGYIDDVGKIEMSFSGRE